MRIKYDLHMHSCLSPCGDDSMTPSTAAGLARLAGLDAAALSDHNTTRNCPAFLKAAEAYGLIGIPAMELTTAEEAHILCLLPTLEAAEELDRYVYERLPDIKNRPDLFGNQLVMDEDDRVLTSEERLLITAVSIGVYEVSELLRSLGGVAVPAHIDRSSFSLLSNLGAISPDMGFNTVELSRAADTRALALSDAGVAGLPFIIDSDAHRPEDIPDAEFSIDVREATAASVIEAVREGAGLQRL